MHGHRYRSEHPPTQPPLQLIEQVLCLTELCEHLHVTAQTIYDLHSQGRGPNGFRVGRTVDATPATHLERTLRPVQPDVTLLAERPADREDDRRC